MTDNPTTAPTGLAGALEASLTDIAELSFDECLKRKDALLGTARTFDHLTEEQLKEFHALSARLRQIPQSAGKPSAKRGGNRAAALTVSDVASDFT